MGISHYNKIALEEVTITMKVLRVYRHRTENIEWVKKNNNIKNDIILEQTEEITSPLRPASVLEGALYLKEAADVEE